MESKASGDQYKIIIHKTFADKFVKHANRAGKYLCLFSFVLLLSYIGNLGPAVFAIGLLPGVFVFYLFLIGCGFIAGRLIDLDRKNWLYFLRRFHIYC